MAMRYDVEVTGTCRICGRTDLPTEMHHIISRHQIKKASKLDLLHLVPGIIRAGTPILQKDPSLEELRDYAINHLPGNITELCGGCHDMTRSSDKWRKAQIRREKRKLRRNGAAAGGGSRRERVRKRREEKRRRRGLFQCKGNIRSGRRCEIAVKGEGAYCKYHTEQADDSES